MDPKFELSVTLPNEDWDKILDVLGDGKFKVVNPLIRKILDQARARNEEQAERQPPRLQPVS